MNLLLIMPHFFDYPDIIKEELCNMGYEVDFFDDRPSANGFVKAIIRINKDMIGSYIMKYFQKIMKTVRSKQYAVVLLISGQSLSFSEDMIKELKAAQPQARFLLYQWDSLRNFPYIERMEKYFDKCYSFDRGDAEAVECLRFLPLFFSRRYEEIGNKKIQDFKYDFCFVGTAHPKKFQFIKTVTKQLNILYPNQYIFFFLPSRLVYIYRKLKNREFRMAHYRDFHFTSLKGDAIKEIFENTKCILDSAQDGQVGLTIRVFEAFGARKKLITTNEDIVNYDFYRPENIYVYRGTIDMDSVFFKVPYQDVDQDIYEKYTLRSWLAEILSC